MQSIPCLGTKAELSWVGTDTSHCAAFPQMALPALSPGSYSESRDSLMGETILPQSLGWGASNTLSPNTNSSPSPAIYFQAAPKLPKFSTFPSNATTLWADAMEKYFWITAANSSPVDCSVKILQVTLAYDIQATFYKRSLSGSAGRKQMSCVIGVQGFCTSLLSCNSTTWLVDAARLSR